MKACAIRAVGFLFTLSASVSNAQSGHMMGGNWHMWGYGGVGAIVLVVIVALFIWAVFQRRK